VAARLLLDVCAALGAMDLFIDIVSGTGLGFLILY